MRVTKTARHLHKPKYQVFFTEQEVERMINTDFFNTETFTGTFTELKRLLSRIVTKENNNG